MGGVGAEFAVLGDSVLGSWAEDIKAWRRGSQRTDQQTEEELAEFIGMPMLDVWQECQTWADANVSRIEAVADALAGHEPPWEMTQQQVRDVLDGL